MAGLGTGRFSIALWGNSAGEPLSRDSKIKPLFRLFLKGKRAAIGKRNRGEESCMYGQ